MQVKEATGPCIGHTKAKEQREADIPQESIVPWETVVFFLQSLHSTLKLRFCQVRLCWVLNYINCRLKEPQSGQGTCSMAWLHLPHSVSPWGEFSMLRYYVRN